MNTQQHIIKKQVFDLRYSSKANAFSLQERVSRIFYSEVLPRMDTLFSTVAVPDTLIRFDMLQVDAGVIPENELEEILPGRILAVIREAIEKISAIQVHDNNFSGDPPGFQNDSDQKPAVTKRHINSETAAIFFYFLRTGSLPWWASTAGMPVALAGSINKNDLEPLITALFEKVPDGIIPTLKKYLQLADIRRRLIYQFSTSFIELIIRHCVPEYEMKLNAVRKALQTFAGQNGLPALELRSLIDEQVLTAIAGGMQQPADFKAIITSFLEQLAQKTHTSLKIIVKNASGHWESTNYDSDIRQLFTRALAALKEEHNIITALLPPSEGGNFDEQPGTAGPVKEADAPLTGSLNSKNAVAIPMSDETTEDNRDPENRINFKEQTAPETEQPGENDVDKLPDAEQKDSQESHLEPTLEISKKPEVTGVIEKLANNSDTVLPVALHKETVEEVYIQNAGLVLVAPYLTGLFNAFGWVHEKELTATDKAIHMTQYLATGTLQEPEYLLLLNKLLCGCPLEEPIALEVTFTNEELSEAEDMLLSLIQNWPVLKNTSPDSLRETFLKRDGKLSRKEDGDWLLQVEQKGVDILLDKLPWTISIVKLPWMPRLLYVEWA